MQCQEFQKHIADYLTGSLDEAIQNDVLDHLAGCEACRSETKGVEWIWRRLAGVPGRPFDPMAMRARFDVMMAEQDHAIRRSLPARFWKPLFAGAAAAAALAFAVAPGWFTERSTAVQQPEPIANVQPRTDLPEPPTTIEDTSNGNAHEAVGVARLEQDIRIEEIEMLVDDAPQGLGNNMTGRTGASAFSARRVGRLLPRSFSLAYLVSSSSLVFDGHITEITPVGGQGLADLRWRVNRVLKGNSQPEMVFRENRNRQVGERAIVFWNVSSRTTLLVFDGARVRMSGFPNDTAWRRLEALTPEQISEEIRQYSQSHEIGISVSIGGEFSPSAEIRGARRPFANRFGPRNQTVNIPGLVSSLPEEFRDRFAALRLVVTPADFKPGAGEPWRGELLLSDAQFGVPRGRGNVPPPPDQIPRITSRGLLRDGAYRVSLDGIPFGYSVKSITGQQTAEGRLDLLRDPLPVSASSAASAAVTLTPDPLDRGVTVRGRVLGVANPPSTAPVWVSMRSDAQENIRTGAVAAQADGQFEFSNVPPGRYIVRVHHSGWPTWLPASAGRASTVMKLTVGQTDLNQDLPLAVPGAYITGKVEVTDRQGRALPIPHDDLFVSFDRSSFLSDRIGPDGTFAATLPVGSYAVGISPLPLGYSLKAITSGSIDLLRAPFNAGSIGSQPITIRIEYRF